jgi:hypothetical protein
MEKSMESLQKNKNRVNIKPNPNNQSFGSISKRKEISTSKRYLLLYVH